MQNSQLGIKFKNICYHDKFIFGMGAATLFVQNMSNFRDLKKNLGSSSGARFIKKRILRPALRYADRLTPIVSPSQFPFHQTAYDQP